MKKKLGIIGCGAVTQNSYVTALKMYNSIDVRYVYDINEELAVEVAQLLGAEAVSKEKLLADSDITVIATPPSTHYQLVKEALAYGKKVICEKPFVGRVTECLELLDIAKANKSKLYVAHFRRCIPSVELANSIIKSGILGLVESVEAYEGGHFAWVTKSGYVFKDPFGGVLFDTGSHTIDTALYIANLDSVELTTNVLQVNRDRQEPSHEIDAEMELIRTDNSKITFKLKLSRRSILANKIRIKCTNGYIDVSTGMTNYIRLGGKSTSTVLYSNINYKELNDCFALQFEQMFADDVQDSIFDAPLFINLTKVLENIANN
jgi:predicted dehydrogenase